MEPPLQVLRTQLQRYLSAHARHRAAVAATGEGAPPAQLTQARRWLTQGWGDEALHEARARGALDDAASSSLSSLLSRARRDADFDAAEDALRRAARQGGADCPQLLLQRFLPVEQAARRGPAALAWAGAMAEPARAYAQTLDRLAPAEPPAGQLAWIERVLPLTGAPMQELVAWLCGATGGESFHGLLAALHGGSAGAVFDPRRRSRDAAACLLPLGFEPVLTGVMRAVPVQPAMAPRCPVFASEPGRDVRVGMPVVDFGLWADLEAVRGVASGLAWALGAVGAEVEQRYAPGVAEAFGGLYAQLMLDREFLARVYDVRGRAADALSRRLLAAYLVDLRLDHMRCMPREGESFAQRDEAQRARINAALQVDCPPPLAHLTWRTRGDDGRLLGTLAGLSLHVGLREAFDSDWYRNPRAAALLRGAALRGGALGSESFCEELGVDGAAAAARLGELLSA